jgi:hypothetical protein
MSDFRKLRMTAKGRELLALAHQGVELQLLNIVVGNGAWPQENQEGDPPVALVSQKKVITVSAIEQSGEVAQVRGMLTNTSMTQGFAITEIGVTALHPVDGEILYMADYCELAKSSYIPDNSGAPVEIPLSLDVLVASSQEVTLQIDDRFFSATKQDIDDHDAEPEAHQSLVDRLHVSTSTITAPAPGAVDVIETPTFESGAFESHFAGVAHSHSQWQVDVAAGDWTAPVHDSGADAVNLVAYTLASDILVVSTIYKVRVRHRCGPDGLWSEWSDPITFTTRDVFTYVAAPTNQSPGSGATDIGETPTLQASTFQVVGGSDSHLESEFRILSGSVVHTSTGLGTVTSYDVPQGILAENTSYTWQCRYRGTSLGWGEWSAVTGFTTMFAFIVGDDAVTYDPTLAADYVAAQDLDTSTGTTTADAAQGFFDTEFQGEGEGDWTKVTVESDVRDPEDVGVEPGSTTSSLVLTSNKTGLLGNGDKILVNDGAAGISLIETVLANVTDGPQVPTGCIHEWSLDGDANDSVGSQNGTVNGSCTFGAGKRGQTLSTPGTDGNYLSLPTAAFDFSAAISFGFWIKTTESPYVIASTQDANNPGFMIDAADGDCYVANGGGYVVNPSSGANAGFNDGAWHHYFFTWDGTTGADKVKIYLDGVLKWTGTATGTASATHKSTVNVGRWSDLTGDTYHYGIEIDEIRVFNRELTAVEVAGLMGRRYTCTGMNPALAAVPDKVFLPAPLYFAHGNGTRILRPDMLARFASEADLVLEDVRGVITQFTVDTADTSGHFDTAKGSKVLPGCRMILDVSGTPTESIISSITGDGTSADSVAIWGIIATGTYSLITTYGVTLDSGKLGLSGFLVSPVNHSIGGTPTASAYSESYVPARAIDGDAGHESHFMYWYVYGQGLPQWLQVQLASAKVITAYTLHGYTFGISGEPKDWTLQASNDGSNWTTLDNRSGIVWSAYQRSQTFTFSNATAYAYYRVNVTATQSAIDHVIISEFALWETAPANEHLVSANEGIATQTAGSNESAWHDGLTSQAYANCYNNTAPSTGDRFVQKQWAAPKRMVRSKLYGPSDAGIWAGGTGEYTMFFEGSNDGTSWTTLATAVTQNASGQVLDTGYISSNTAFLYHRWRINVDSASGWCVAEVEFYAETKNPPVGQYYSVVTGKAAVGLANVTDINFSTATETVGGTNDHAYYSLCFDDHTYRVWSGSAWRDIVSDAAAVHGGTDGVWCYRDNVDGWAAAYADNVPAAVSQAVGSGINNQMTSATMAGIADVDWPDVSSAEVLKVAVALYTSDASAVPKVDSVDFNCDFAAGTMGDFELAPLASASWIDDAGTLVVTEVSEEIEPANTFRGVAIGLTQLTSGAQISTPKINTWKQGA